MVLEFRGKREDVVVVVVVVVAVVVAVVAVVVVVVVVVAVVVAVVVVAVVVVAVVVVVVGCWLLVVGGWLLVVGCWLCVVCCLLFVVCCLFLFRLRLRLRLRVSPPRLCLSKSSKKNAGSMPIAVRACSRIWLAKFRFHGINFYEVKQIPICSGNVQKMFLPTVPQKLHSSSPAMGTLSQAVDSSLFGTGRRPFSDLKLSLELRWFGRENP